MKQCAIFIHFKPATMPWMMPYAETYEQTLQIKRAWRGPLV
jgi:hypothetical protein